MFSQKKKQKMKHKLLERQITERIPKVQDFKIFHAKERIKRNFSLILLEIAFKEMKFACIFLREKTVSFLYKPEWKVQRAKLRSSSAKLCLI